MIAEPVTKDFSVPAGVDYPIRMRYLINDVVVDLTGATIRGAMGKSFSGAVSITFSSANSNIFLDTGTGYFGIDLDASATAVLEATSYHYNIEVVLPSGDTTRAMQGKITLLPRVS